MESIDLRPKKKKEPKPNPWLKFLRTVCNVGMVAINIICAIGLIVSGHIHHVSPSHLRFATITAMTFPGWFFGMVILFAFDLAWWRRTSWIAGIALLCCISPIRAFFPLNLPKWPMNAEQRQRSFTLMTYNVNSFDDYSDTTVKENRQLNYILKKSPDIVCVQEARFVAPNETNKIQQSQLDALHNVYPYVLTSGNDFALFSKYPAKPINLDYPTEEFASGDMTAWRLNVDGRVLNLFSVHLRSLGLTSEDKEAYRDIVKLDSLSRNELREARVAIMPKIADAAVEREQQVLLLQKYLGKYGGKNAIVCGDFNDVELCYGINLLQQECHMQAVYPEVAFGPDITYYGSDLFFRIDHILYRGAMRPYKIRRGHISASDHYPLIATFIWQ